MRLHHPHPWEVSPGEATAIQERLRHLVRLEDCMGEVRRVAGTDVGFERGTAVTRAAVAVLSLPGLELLECAVARRPTSFPYVPGLLSFREIPAILEALQKLERPPDLLLVDGQGTAHPRRFGIASHLGVVTGIPSVGVAKSRLIGWHGEPPDERGAWTPLQEGEETIGAVLRSRKGVRPIYVSPGHCVTLERALEYVMRCVTRYRLPETTRQAHRLASGT